MDDNGVIKFPGIYKSRILLEAWGEVAWVTRALQNSHGEEARRVLDKLDDAFRDRVGNANLSEDTKVKEWIMYIKRVLPSLHQSVADIVHEYIALWAPPEPSIMPGSYMKLFNAAMAGLSSRPVAGNIERPADYRRVKRSETGRPIRYSVVTAGD